MGLTIGIETNENLTTKQYEWNEPIFRRGETQFIYLKHAAFIQPNSFSGIKFRLEANGQKIDDTNIIYDSPSYDYNKWNIKTPKEIVKKAYFEIMSPYNCEIGRYEIFVINDNHELGSEKFLMMFNPWNSNDDVYMLSENERQEYVLNESTIIYMGSSTHISSISWSLDQFKEETIITFLTLLEKIDRKARASPYLLSRELTALVNNLDDNGVLIGNWSSNYDDGISPLAWSGSYRIFKKFNKHKRPVKYGQCWVFAAINCSLFRLIGIPCRIITCFECLHDSDGTLDKEEYYDNEYNHISYLSNDSIWNFHCWNECFFARPDLNSMYNGWQILDATPQERSIDKRYTCGPSPLYAIKYGNIEKEFDTLFIFSEVNGDIVYKIVNKDTVKIVHVDSDRIGKCISTKMVESTQRLDITDSYKYTNDSIMEFMIRKHAKTIIKSNDFISKNIITILQANRNNFINIGDPLDLNVILNEYAIEGTKIVIKCFILRYPGHRIHTLADKIVTLNRNQNTVSLHVDPKDIYNETLTDLSSLLVEVFFSYGKHIFTRNSVKYTIITPKFDIILPNKFGLNEKDKIDVKIFNPFFFDLKNIIVRLDTSLTKQKLKNRIKEIQSKKTITTTFHVLPSLKGYFEICATIYGQHVPTFKEYASITVA